MADMKSCSATSGLATCSTSDSQLSPSQSEDELCGRETVLQFILRNEREGKILSPSRKQQLLRQAMNLTEAAPSSSEDETNTGCMPSDNINQRKTAGKLTEAEKYLFEKLASVKRDLSKYKNRFEKQSKSVMCVKKIISNPAYVKVIENLPASPKELMKIEQFRELSTKEKATTFNMGEKITAAATLKQSPKSYIFLRRIFLLPACKSLVKLLVNSEAKSNINDKIFAQLQIKTANMKLHEKICILLFDEMPLQGNVKCTEDLSSKGKITWVEMNRGGAQPIFANYVQVFMIRGLIKNYKQPVYYTFSSNTAKGAELAHQLKEVIRKLNTAGLQVIATVCSQADNNRQAIEYLMKDATRIFLKKGDNPKYDFILVDGKEIVPLYDPPCLLMGIRNELFNKSLQFEIDNKIKIAKWHHLKLFQNENRQCEGAMLVPKLKDFHIKIRPYKRIMKVKYAAQVFSSTVASKINHLADNGVLPEECKDTADLLLFMDKLFDSVNGSNMKKTSKPLLGPVTLNSIHHETWTEAIRILRSMAFITTTGKPDIVLPMENWAWTLKGIQYLLRNLENDYNITSVWMRQLNQDPIVNFFYDIRSRLGPNKSPTPEQFESIYTALVHSANPVHTRDGICEDDLGTLLVTLKPKEDCDSDDDISEDKAILNIRLNIESESIQNEHNRQKKKNEAHKTNSPMVSKQYSRTPMTFGGIGNKPLMRTPAPVISSNPMGKGRTYDSSLHLRLPS